MVTSPPGEWDSAQEFVPSVPRRGDFDADAMFARVPDEFRVRGLFFGRCVAPLRDEWDAIVPKLRDPPALVVGRPWYQPFHEYPLSDYWRVFDAAARATHPQQGGREAWRRYARDEVTSYASTMVGRVTMSLLNEPATALLHYPEVFRMLARGPTASAKRLDGRRVLLEVTDAAGPFEYAVGVFEGMVMAFGKHPRIRGKEQGNVRLYEVSWHL